jgi:hypothetical protein
MVEKSEVSLKRERGILNRNRRAPQTAQSGGKTEE